ncbi:hypothetical protein RJ640_002539 [Escallonia rubra]|uniref:F-box domain-containing protein n=1 Tax=Escallonia rubra TaxID=112253 RepID=A0AA88S278_9ASTE|nr:hypothetical protein RJ640_002539 [Escallonia rubra]
MTSAQDQQDHFDRLPDAILLVIFNKLHDGQSLCRSKAVCKRFGSIIPQISTVSVAIPRRNINDGILVKNKESKVSSDQDSKPAAGKPQKKLLKRVVNSVVLRPLQLLARFVLRKSSVSSSCSCDDEFSLHSPNEILKGFDEIRSLSMELPGHGSDIGSSDGGVLLKWNAKFGSELKSCVILGATSCEKSDNSGEDAAPDSNFSDEDLKLRVVWTISCLIAASSRHHLLQKLVPEHRLLENAAITDAGKQGRIRMAKEEIEELRSSTEANEEAAAERSRVPALRMKMWHVPELELQGSGRVMKGATLVVIRPVGEKKRAEKDGELVMGAFGDGGEEEKVLGEAVRKMMKKKKTCTLEMNSF